MKKKKKFLQKNKGILWSGALLSACLVFVFALSQDQDLRSRADAGQVQPVGVSSANTGSLDPATSLTISKPAGTQEGDVLLAILQGDYGHIGTAPEGWTVITQRIEKDGSKEDLTVHAYFKVATASEPASYTWAIVNQGGEKGSLGGGTIVTSRGVDTARPIAANAINPETKSESQMDCPSVTSPAGGLLVCGFINDDPPTDIRVPASMTRVSNFTIRDNDAHAVAYELRTQAGATGKRTANFSLSDDIKGGGNNDMGIAIVLQPKAITPTVTAPITVTEIPPTSIQPTNYCLGCNPTEEPSDAPQVTPVPSVPSNLPVDPGQVGQAQGALQLLLLILDFLRQLFSGF